jgi:hypothetical protein
MIPHEILVFVSSRQEHGAPPSGFMDVVHVEGRLHLQRRQEVVGMHRRVGCSSGGHCGGSMVVMMVVLVQHLRMMHLVLVLLLQRLLQLDQSASEVERGGDGALLLLLRRVCEMKQQWRLVRVHDRRPSDEERTGANEKNETKRREKRFECASTRSGTSGRNRSAPSPHSSAK